MGELNVMLGSVSIGGWDARRVDKKIAAKAEEDNHAKAGTVTAAKHLMAGVASHKNVKDKATLIRAWWSGVSLPWFDGKGAPRIVNVDGVQDLIVQIGDREREYMDVVETFIAEYPAVRTSREFEMGDLFDPTQFPSTRDLKRRFYFRTDWCAVPKVADIRLGKDMDPAKVKQIQEEAEKRAEARIQNAMNIAAQRLHKVVESMHKTMAVKIGEKGGKFNDTKLQNILDLVDLMPALNITNDPKLAEMAKQAKKLATKSPDELREDETKRAAAAKEAAALAKKLAGAFDVTTEDEEE